MMNRFQTLLSVSSCAATAGFHVAQQLDILVPCYYDPIIDSVCDFAAGASSDVSPVGPGR